MFRGDGEWAGETVGPDVWEICRELIPAGSVFAFLAGHRGALFPAEMFADMYPWANGRPSMPPQTLAEAITLQALHGLSDLETVQELRCDLRWKAACGIGLHHTLQAAARHQTANDPDWQADHRRLRPPVERAVAWLVQHGNRRLRHRGTIANNIWLHTRAAALNLRRLVSLGLTRIGGARQLAPATT
ncbi:transposase [Streptomyces sp. NPDC059169]|uniref:transposase n=1 Tax=Streptomyces sp. NPDC059169 TaxID=3346754 RepID=UPI0036B1640E